MSDSHWDSMAIRKLTIDRTLDLASVVHAVEFCGGRVSAREEGRVRFSGRLFGLPCDPSRKMPFAFGSVRYTSDDARSHIEVRVSNFVPVLIGIGASAAHCTRELGNASWTMLGLLIPASIFVLLSVVVSSLRSERAASDLVACLEVPRATSPSHG